MPEELAYQKQAAAGYDDVFGAVSSYFAPFLLSAAHIAPGLQVLDIASGTGLVTKAALDAVGSAGHVTAADISPAMVEKARERLATESNAAVAVEDGQALSFQDASFDAVVCSLGLMFFPDPLSGLREFHRVLRHDGWAAVSVNTVPSRSFNIRINIAIARFVPELAAAAQRIFSLGDVKVMEALFRAAQFRDVAITMQANRFVLPSFESYFRPVEQGAGATGQAFVSLPEAARKSVREEVRRDLRDTGGPVEVEVEYLFASGRR